MKKLQYFYCANKGKTSDKWELYLSVYDRLLSPLRKNKISLLEIGIQNGGSLEIWAKYFSSAKKIIGCDINKKCGKLKFFENQLAKIHSIEFINSMCIIRKAEPKENTLRRRYVTGKYEHLVVGNKKLNLRPYQSFTSSSEHINFWSNLKSSPDEQYEEMQHEIQKLTFSLNSILGSRSWRITRPLRSLYQQLLIFLK